LYRKHPYLYLGFGMVPRRGNTLKGTNIYDKQCNARRGGTIWKLGWWLDVKWSLARSTHVGVKYLTFACGCRSLWLEVVVICVCENVIGTWVWSSFILNVKTTIALLSSKVCVFLWFFVSRNGFWKMWLCSQCCCVMETIFFALVIGVGRRARGMRCMGVGWIFESLIVLDPSWICLWAGM